ncbi:MAG: ABC transporter permease subunit [Deltaproteobacteria bacterium]|nr:MAG: ABC transporter permease subunit [Deltaproteobacteria bacterium]
MPGSPAEIICPPERCGAEATAELERHFHLDAGPLGFYTHWLGNAVQFDFGTSWRVMAGVRISEMLAGALPATTKLILIAMTLVLGASALATAQIIPKRLDPVWQAIGLLPTVILALLCAAYVTITYGAVSYDGWPGTLRLLMGGLVLGVADGTLGQAIQGTRSIFEEEVKQRYVGIAVLRGESVLSNTLPNVMPALAGQLRGRVLAMLSGSVVVEVVLGVEGLGQLVWDGTLKQDFGLVLAAAWAYALLSSALLAMQALVEIGTAWYVRRSPVVPEVA